MYNVLVSLDIICGIVKLDQRVTIDGFVTNDEVGEPVWIVVGFRSTQLVVEMFHQRWCRVQVFEGGKSNELPHRWFACEYKQAG